MVLVLFGVGPARAWCLSPWSDSDSGLVGPDWPRVSGLFPAVLGELAAQLRDGSEGALQVFLLFGRGSGLGLEHLFRRLKLVPVFLPQGAQELVGILLYLQALGRELAELAEELLVLSGIRLE